MSLVSRRDQARVRVLTLDRPEQRNALSAALRHDLVAALREADGDAGVGSIVLTGAGTVFAAGADLKELLARSSDEQRAFLRPPHIYSVIEGLRKPVIAAINGHALGAGLELATACDLRIAHPGAKLGQPEIRLALIPGGGGTQRLPRLIGPGQAARLVLTGDAVTAEEALRIGLVDEVHDEPVARAVELGAVMAGHDAEALALAKAALGAARTMTYEDGLAAETEAFVALHGSEAARSRIRTFLGKAP